MLLNKEKTEWIDLVVCTYLISINIHLISGSFNALLQNVCFLLIIGFCICKQGFILQVTPYMVHYSLFLGLGCLSLLWTPTTTGTMTLLRVLVKGFVGASFLTQLYSGEAIGRFWKITFVALLIEIAYVLVVTPSGDWGIGYVGKRLGMDTVRFSMQTMLAACLAYFYWHQSRKFGYLAVMMALCIVSMITGKRTGLIFLGIFVSVYLLANAKYWSRRVLVVMRLAILFVVAIIIIYNVPVLYETVGVRITDLIETMLGNGKEDLSAVHRMMLMERSWESFLDKPILGNGLNAQRYILQSERFVQVTYAHNNMLEIAAGLGAVGVVLYYSMYIRTIWNCMCMKGKNLHPYSMLVLSLIIGYFVCDFVQVIYESYFENIIIAMLLTSSIDGIGYEKEEV